RRSHVPETLLGDMRKIDQDAHPVTGPDQLETGIRQSQSRIGRLRIGKGNPVAENIVAAPDRSERTQPCRIENLEIAEIRIDRLAAFHVHDARENAVADRLADIVRRTADTPCPRPIEPQSDRRLFQRDLERWRKLERGCERGLVMAFVVRLLEDEITRGDVDGAETAGEAATSGSRPVDMALGGAIAEFSNRITAGFHRPPEPQEHVVMAVEHQFHGAYPDCRGGRFEEVDPAILATAYTTAREGSWICAASSAGARSPRYHLAAIALHLLQQPGAEGGDRAKIGLRQRRNRVIGTRRADLMRIGLHDLAAGKLGIDQEERHQGKAETGGAGLRDIAELLEAHEIGRAS